MIIPKLLIAPGYPGFGAAKKALREIKFAVMLNKAAIKSQKIISLLNEIFSPEKYI